jgi:hypothetical protein
MGYQKANGQWANTLDVTVLDSAARTATFQGPAVEIGDRGTAALDLVISAASGTTPSLTVTIETSKDGSTNWQTVAAYAAQNAAGTTRKVFAGLDRFVRANCAISGTTPSFTFGINGEAK